MVLSNNNDRQNDNNHDRCVLTRLAGAFQPHMTNGFCSVSRGDFEMRTEEVPPKLSQEACSISSTDTSEIGFGNTCVYTQGSTSTFCCTDQLQEKGKEGDVL